MKHIKKLGKKLTEKRKNVCVPKKQKTKNENKN